MDIEAYKKANGFYDDERIMLDAGRSARAAAFASIFGDDDEQAGGDMSPEWQALLDEARRRNAALNGEIEAKEETEARELISSGVITPRLVDLGYAYRVPTELDTTTYELNERGRALTL